MSVCFTSSQVVLHYGFYPTDQRNTTHLVKKVEKERVSVLAGLHQLLVPTSLVFPFKWSRVQLQALSQ